MHAPARPPGADPGAAGPHCEPLTDEQIAELNPIIRSAIYTALYVIHHGDTEPWCQRESEYVLQWIFRGSPLGLGKRLAAALLGSTGTYTRCRMALLELCHVTGGQVVLWALGILVAVIAGMALYSGHPGQVSVVFALALLSLALAWVLERRAGAGRAQGVAAVVFGVAINMASMAIPARLFLLPVGSAYDSSQDWVAEWTIWAAAAAVGLALGVRALVRASGRGKLLGLLGCCLGLAPMWTSQIVYLMAVRGRGLEDIW